MKWGRCGTTEVVILDGWGWDSGENRRERQRKNEGVMDGKIVLAGVGS
jgi:hypothetical protein